MAVVQVRRYEMEEEEVLQKQSTGKPALERAAKVHQAMKERPQQQRRTLDFAASAGAGSNSREGFDAELEEANRGLPLGWKARRSQKTSKGRIYWYHEGGTAGEPQWHRP
jgi:hypothetical protein